MGMREEFEAWFEQNKEFMLGTRKVSKGDCFFVWQASRAALVLDFTPCNVQHASYNQVECYSINDVMVIASQHGVGVRTK